MRSREPAAAALYEAAQAFRERCLGANDSLFTPGASIWSPTNLDELVSRFINQPDLSSDQFLTKFERQLAGATGQVIQLAAESVFVHIVIAGNVGGAAKRQLIGTVLSWMPTPVNIPTDLDAALDVSIAHAGTAFSTRRPYQLAFLLTFARAWKELSDSQRDDALADPWAFKAFAWSVPMASGAFAQREALLHLVHPDTFEPILARDNKEAIASAFLDLTDEAETDVDRRLFAIRAGLAAEHGERFSFYDPEVARLWRTGVPSEGVRYVKIATGEGGKFWDADLAGKFIAVGWAEVGDLRAYGSWEDFRANFASNYPYKGRAAQVTTKAKELWTLTELKPGDVVVANRGESEVLGVGTVVEPGYEWDPAIPDAPHIVHVEWDTSKARKIAPIGAWRTRTVMDLTPQQVRDIVTGRAVQPLTASDFEVLERYRIGKAWADAPFADQTRLGLLRKKVREYAEYFQRELQGTADLSPFVSTLNPNGRTASFYWGCAYPTVAGNKSYGFQLFLIVSPDDIEFGFGAGSGDSQIQDQTKTGALVTQLTAARERLAATKGAAWWSDLDREVRDAGLEYRRSWREKDVEPLPDYDAWLTLASGRNGASTAISRFMSRTEAEALGPHLAGRLVELVRPLVRLMDAIYAARKVVDEGGGGVTIEALAQQLYLEPDYLDDVHWLLEDRRQLVFYGPPGTGKTFVAEAFAEWFAGDANRVEVIQFHPSYAYEDFVEGIRPDLDGKELRYRLVPGILRRFAARAKDDKHHRYVLIVDEINRANLARVFGELLYLLEYRNGSVTLPYSQERFSLPENLFVIGTMNTADRSIALVDFALRRRFHFIHFPADVEILRRWLQAHRPEMEEVAQILDWVNRRIGQEDFSVGFSYFMRGDLDQEVLERIWARSIIPAVQEYYFNEPAAARGFQLSDVRKALQGNPLTPNVDDHLDSVPRDAADQTDDGATDDEA